MAMERRAFLAAGGAAFLAGCADVASSPGALVAPRRLAPLKFDPGRLMKITVCLRPFRPSGPRLELERFGDKTVVHNYGHGGSGWSLSWGCAAEAAALARSAGHRDIAVIGAGVIGMTTALRLIEAGASVTIYASDFPAETRSARATGVWSPSSRIGLSSHTGPGFAARWEGWARSSWAGHLQSIGLAGDPVEFLNQYNVLGGNSPRVPETRSFSHLDRRIDDLTPDWGDTPESERPFPAHFTRSGPTMIFNVSEYFDRLVRLFLMHGGRMDRRDFPDRASALSLSEPVIVNCMGFGAKAIWGDAELVPVRGQIGWLLPQPEARYALWHDEVQAVSRRDGVVVQYLGPNEDWGYGEADEHVDRNETLNALATLRSLYAEKE
jgi:glycine/D-amino acid oxidase-like deaminating enzyme